MSGDGDPEVQAAIKLLASLDPAAHHRSLADLARTDPRSVLGSLDYSSKLSYHDPTVVSVEPRPRQRDDIALFARAACPPFDELLVAAFEDPAVVPVLADVHHRLFHEHANVAVVTNHGQIIDIALVLAALALAMTDPDRTYGVLGERLELEDLVQSSNVLVSRMVTTRQAFGVPAIAVLEHLCRTFLSVPQTTSRRRAARLAPEVVRANNVVMRHALNEQMAHGSQLIAMAASGSQDLTLAANLVHRVRATWRQRRGVDPGPAPSLHLQPLYRGTISLMLEARDVLPIATSLVEDHLACVVGPLTRVRTEDDCHGVMEWIAEAHERATGVNTVYHQHEDPLLVQVRDVLRG